MMEHHARERHLEERVEVESSGTGAWHVGEDADGRMRRVAARHGLVFHHPARQLSRTDLSEGDLIFAMDRGHYREILAAGRHTSINEDDLRSRLYLFRQFDPDAAETVPLPVDETPDVADPYYGGDRGFEEVYRIVDRTCTRILDEIEAGRLP